MSIFKSTTKNQRHFNSSSNIFTKKFNYSQIIHSNFCINYHAVNRFFIHHSKINNSNKYFGTHLTIIQNSQDLVEQNSKPIICLYGWLGCQPKHLDKIEKMYHKLGFKTVSIIPSITSPLFESSTQRCVDEMLKKINQIENEQTEMNEHIDTINNESIENTNEFSSKLKPRRYIVHVFSGNGIYTMGKQLLKENKNGLTRDYIGFIFDSSPPKVDLETFSRGFIAAIKSNYKYIEKITNLFKNTKSNNKIQPTDDSYYDIPFLTPLIKLFFKIFLERYTIQYEKFKLEVLSLIATNTPTMFIYSRNDIVVRSKDIEEFIEIIKERGVTDIEKLYFLNSGHIMHFKENPVEYEIKVSQFVKKCIKQSDSKI